MISIYLQQQTCLQGHISKNIENKYIYHPKQLYEINLPILHTCSLRHFLYQMEPIMLLYVINDQLLKKHQDIVSLSKVLFFRPYASINNVLEYEILYFSFAEYTKDQSCAHFPIYKSSLSQMRHIITSKISSWVSVSKPILIMDIDQTIATVKDDLLVDQLSDFISHGKIRGINMDQNHIFTFIHDVMFAPDAFQFFYQIIDKVELFFLTAGDLNYARSIINLLEENIKKIYPNWMFDTLDDRVISVRKDIHNVELKTFEHIIPYYFIENLPAPLKRIGVDDKKHVWSVDSQRDVIQVLPFFPNQKICQLLPIVNLVL